MRHPLNCNICRILEHEPKYCTGFHYATEYKKALEYYKEKFPESISVIDELEQAARFIDNHPKYSKWNHEPAEGINFK